MVQIAAAYWIEDMPADLAEKGETSKELKENSKDLLDCCVRVEIYDNLSTDRKSPDHYLKKINGISVLIEIENRNLNHIFGDN